MAAYKITDAMSAVRPLPTGARAWHDSQITHYLFYKGKKSWCSRCGRDLDRTATKCPSCGCDLKPFHVLKTMNHKDHGAETAYYSLERFEKSFVMSFGIVSTEFHEVEYPTEDTRIIEWERAFVVKGREFVISKWFENDGSVVWQVGKYVDYSSWSSSWKRARPTIMHCPTDWREFIAGSEVQYTGVEDYLKDGGWSAWYALLAASREPDIMLVKRAGFGNLYHAYFKRQADYRFFSVKVVKKYKQELKQMGDPTWFDYYWLVRCKYHNIASYPELKEYFRKHSGDVEFFLKIKKLTGMTSMRCAITAAHVSPMKDYVDEMKMLMEIYGHISPKKCYFESCRAFDKQHIETSALYREVVAERERVANEKKFSSVARKLLGLEYQDSELGLAIVAPKSVDDIIREGQELNHCVASYTGKVVDGQTSIVFLRKIEELDKACVTVEYRNGSVVQYRGYENKGPLPEHTEEFLARWKKQIALRGAI